MSASPNAPISRPTSCTARRHRAASMQASAQLSPGGRSRRLATTLSSLSTKKRFLLQRRCAINSEFAVRPAKDSPRLIRDVFKPPSVHELLQRGDFLLPGNAASRQRCRAGLAFAKANPGAARRVWHIFKAERGGDLLVGAISSRG